MILSKEDLKRYIKEDNKQYGNNLPNVRDMILNNERWYTYKLKHELRYIEYLINVKKQPFRKVRLYWHYLHFKRLCFKLKYILFPNTIGAGLSLYHIGDFTHVNKNVLIGENCTITVGTVFGHRKGGDEPVKVGNNCYFGIGCKVLGSVNIGNNVIIGGGSIVLNDIPDNAVVAGNPAKVIRYKE